MCGFEDRHDFVIMGHDVNMAARYMCKALPNQILSSQGFNDAGKGKMKFTEKEITIKGGKVLTVYIPGNEVKDSEEFKALYKDAIEDNISGRKLEVEAIKLTLVGGGGGVWDVCVLGVGGMGLCVLGVGGCMRCTCVRGWGVYMCLRCICVYIDTK